jgi:hypothetical protein
MISCILAQAEVTHDLSPAELKIHTPEAFTPSHKILHEGISKMGCITFPFSQHLSTNNSTFRD